MRPATPRLPQLPLNSHRNEYSPPLVEELVDDEVVLEQRLANGQSLGLVITQVPVVARILDS